MRINLRSEDIKELSRTREYVDGYAVPEPGGMREYAHDFVYKGIQSSSRQICIPGMRIGLFGGSRDRELVYSVDSDFPYLQMHFEVTTSGCQYFPHGLAEPVTLILQGQHSLLFYPVLNGKLHYLPKHNAFSVEVELSIDFLQRIFAQDLGVLREFGEQIERNNPAIMGNGSYPITPAMREILFQIRDCEYAGALKKAFLEAKVTELLLLQIDQINSVSSDRKFTLKPSDIEKIRAVRDTLLNDLYANHSIEQLSKLAGINRTKLQSGFRELFGNTIFGFITDARMEQARETILQRKYNTISEVSALVGYKNPQHFTTAFKKKFGIVPSDLK